MVFGWMFISRRLSFSKSNHTCPTLPIVKSLIIEFSFSEFAFSPSHRLRLVSTGILETRHPKGILASSVTTSPIQKVQKQKEAFPTCRIPRGLAAEVEVSISHNPNISFISQTPVESWQVSAVDSGERGTGFPFKSAKEISRRV